MHQFSKVELFVICTPEQSEGVLAELCDMEEELFSSLGLHFKILVCIYTSQLLSLKTCKSLPIVSASHVSQSSHTWVLCGFGAASCTLTAAVQ